MEFIFATGNAHKLSEVTSILPDRINLLSLKEVGYKKEIPEPYQTIEENAIHKAKVIYECYEKNCFAEDTGLEVEALNGDPGVYSARYAGEDCVAENNMNLLLANLEGVKNRKARFKTISALIVDGEIHTFEGIVEGQILGNKRGKNGFGYDPIFMPNGYSKSYAEMENDIKNKISHRSLSINKLCNFIIRNIQ